MTFITKKALPRRTMLKGMGTMMTLPLLGAMVPAMTATANTAANPVPRLGFFYAPNGMFLPNFHPEGNGGKDYEITPILKPLEDYREQMVVISGLSNSGVVSPNEGGGVHTRAHGGWLSGVLLARTVIAAPTKIQHHGVRPQHRFLTNVTHVLFSIACLEMAAVLKRAWHN